jgi:hypothetical protein
MHDKLTFTFLDLYNLADLFHDALFSINAQ